MNKLADVLCRVGVSWGCGDAYVPGDDEESAIAELVALGLVKRFEPPGAPSRGYRTTKKGEPLWGWLTTDAVGLHARLRRPGTLPRHATRLLVDHAAEGGARREREGESGEQSGPSCRGGTPAHRLPPRLSCTYRVATTSCSAPTSDATSSGERPSRGPAMATTAVARAVHAVRERASRVVVFNGEPLAASPRP